MGANAQTSVPAFTSGQVLTAQQQTEINTGIPVFATTTTRDAAFGGTGEKTLAEGQFAYIEASNTTQYYDGAAWQTVGGGLTLIKTQTIGSAVSSVTVSDAFSSAYDNYRIVLGGTGTCSTNNDGKMTLGAASANYFWGTILVGNAGGVSGQGSTSDSAFQYVTWGNTAYHMAVLDVINPFLTTRTMIVGGTYATAGNSRGYQGVLNDATSYTSFTFTTSAGTMTGGTIRVYGYQNS